MKFFGTDVFGATLEITFPCPCPCFRKCKSRKHQVIASNWLSAIHHYLTIWCCRRMPYSIFIFMLCCKIPPERNNQCSYFACVWFWSKCDSIHITSCAPFRVNYFSFETYFLYFVKEMPFVRCEWIDTIVALKIHTWIIDRNSWRLFSQIAFLVEMLPTEFVIRTFTQIAREN